MRVKGMVSSEEFRNMVAGAPLTGEGKESQRRQILRRMYNRTEKLTRWLIDKGQREGVMVMPMPPSITNGSFPKLHWRSQKEIRESYQGYCDAFLELSLNPPPPKEPLDYAEVHVLVCVARRGDDDNQAARRKWAQDWLVKNGYIVDDSTKHLKVLSSEQVVVPQKEQRIEFKFVKENR